MASQSPAFRRFLGYAVIAIGALLALLSGACTATFFITGLLSQSPGGDVGQLLTSLIFGLPFVAIGIGLVVAGRSIARERDPPASPPGGSWWDRSVK